MVIRRITRVPPLSAQQMAREELPEWSDRQLLSALAESDPRAGVLLYDRLIRVVEWTISRIMGQRCAEHEDLVQGAFEQIVVTLHAQRFAHRCSLTSWASAVSCNVALNALRSRRRQRALRVESGARTPEPHDPTNLENQLAARQALERVRRELGRMNPGRAQALVLHEVNGLELGEIAAVLGISVMAAQSRLSRGRRELCERLDAAASDLCGAAVPGTPGGALDD